MLTAFMLTPYSKTYKNFTLPASGRRLLVTPPTAARLQSIHSKPEKNCSNYWSHLRRWKLYRVVTKEKTHSVRQHNRCTAAILHTHPTKPVKLPFIRHQCKSEAQRRVQRSTRNGSLQLHHGYQGHTTHDASPSSPQSPQTKRWSHTTTMVATNSGPNTGPKLSDTWAVLVRPRTTLSS